MPARVQATPVCYPWRCRGGFGRRIQDVSRYESKSPKGDPPHSNPQIENPSLPYLGTTDEDEDGERETERERERERERESKEGEGERERERERERDRP